jgi:hypothetical protein
VALVGPASSSWEPFLRELSLPPGPKGERPLICGVLLAIFQEHC